MNPTTYPYPKRRRLCSKKRIQQVFTSGKFWGFSGLGFKYLTSTHHQHTKTVISMPKKIGNAVQRNQIKRWLREALRKHKQTLALDLAIFAKPTAQLSWPITNQAVQNFFKSLA